MRTNLDKDLGKYSQLWLDADEWKKPIKIKNNGRIVAYLLDRKVNDRP
jgi:hypothetical protein